MISLRILSFILVLLGAGVMLYSIFQTNELLGLIRGNKSSKIWRFLYYLMVFFLLGYGAVAILISFEITAFILPLMGAIFFCGACFVASVVRTSMSTIKELQALTIEQLATQREKEVAEAIAQLHTEFLTMMSHELRTPLNAILGFSAMLEISLKSEEERSFLKHISQGGEKLLNIVERVLKYTEIKSSHFQIKKNIFSIEKVIQNSIRTQLELQEQESHNKISYTLADNFPEKIFSDHLHLAEVLNHLINNALKFTQDGIIHIAVAAYNRDLYCAIQDTGIGIKPEHIKNLFHPFRMGDNTPTRVYNGLGLGLILAQHILEAMGGQIWIESHGLVAGKPPDYEIRETYWQEILAVPEMLKDKISTQVFFLIPNVIPDNFQAI